MNIIFSWLQQQGVQKVIEFVYNILKVIRIVVPIGLIIMTTLDITKKVINPNEKDGQKKIMYRAIAALIVFFVPTLINIVFDIGGIKEETLDIENNNININNNELTKVNIINCPSASKTFQEGDTIILNTDISTNYSNSIIWSVTKGNNYVKVIPNNSNLSANINVSKVEYDTMATIQVVANGKSDTCVINLETFKLDDVKILNCDNSQRYVVGDLITFNTSIPKSFKGEVKWDYEKDIMIIKDNTQKDKVTFEIIKRPETGYSVPGVAAGGKSSACTMNISSVKKLEVNCPNENTIYHVGDKIYLKSNLPTSYNGSINWNNGTTNPGVFSIKSINNGLEAEVEIINKPNNSYGHVSLIADHDSLICRIRIE